MRVPEPGQIGSAGVSLPHAPLFGVSKSVFSSGAIQLVLREVRELTRYVGLFCVALMVTLVGCGASHPPLTIVTGTVTYDGEPLADATVAIMPDGGVGTSKPADGMTDSSGQFTSVSYKQFRAHET